MIFFLSLPFFFLFSVLPFASNPTVGSQPGGAAAWVSAWRGDGVGLGLEELRRGFSTWRGDSVGLGLEEL